MNYTINLSFKPRKWQEECIKNMTQFSVWALHRRAGKTTLAINLIAQYCLTKPGRYLYIAPTLKQAREIAWQTMREVANDFIVEQPGGRVISLVDIYESDNSVRFHNGSVIKLAGADNPDSLRGNKLSGAVLDEVAQIPREVWSEVVQPALADSNGWAIFIGTPKGINLFSELYMRGQDPKFKPDWSSARYTCYETDALSEQQIERLKRDQSEEEFKREMLCDFSASASNQLLSLDDVIRATKRRADQNSIAHYEQIMGVDVARYGDDRSVIIIRQGPMLKKILTFHGLDLVKLSEQVAIASREYGVKTIYVDGTGVGGGVPDILRTFGINCFDVNFAQKSNESQYANKRSEIWCRLAQWIKSEGVLPQEDKLMQELAAPQYERDDNGKILLEPKKKIRDRLGFSPDLADALALTFAGWTSELKAFEEPFAEIFSRRSQCSDPIQRFERSVRGRKRGMHHTRAGFYNYLQTGF